MQTSVFSECLAALLKHSLKLDGGTGTDIDFIDLQKLEARITRAHNNSYFDGAGAQALTAIAGRLHKEYRTALKLN